MIPLTLRAMHRTRHPRGLARTQPALLLVSVLALLALACVPALAQAETVYETEKTNIPEESKPTHHKPKNNPETESSSATASNKGGGGPNGGNSNGSGSGNASEGGASGAGDGGSKGQGNPGSGSSTQSGTGGNQGNTPAVEGNTEVGKPASASHDSGSSSPLVPILIAIAVLAAISIGAVVYRQRRGRPGSPVSPKAG